MMDLFNGLMDLGICPIFAVVYRIFNVVFVLYLNHAFGHHSDSVLECLSFVAEPYSDDLAFVAELMCQSSDFSA